jgi:mRNA interferase RelE/StbE
VDGYSVRLKSSAAKEIDALPTRADRQRVVSRIADLAVNPRPTGSEKLAGHEDRYRIRQGDYRIVYAVDDREHSVVVFKVGHRKDVYRLP